MEIYLDPQYELYQRLISMSPAWIATSSIHNMSSTNSAGMAGTVVLKNAGAEQMVKITGFGSTTIRYSLEMRVILIYCHAQRLIDLLCFSLRELLLISKGC